MEPYIVAGWRTDAGWLARHETRPLFDTALDEATLAKLRQLMWSSTSVGWSNGAAVNAENASPGVAGKTGSAEWSNDNDAAHAWFIGFFPAEAPRIALAVLVERGGAGPEVSVRAAQHILASEAVSAFVRGDEAP